MSNGSKKPIIRRMAWLGVVVLGLGAVVMFAALFAAAAQERRAEREQRQRQQKLVERARGMLAEFAKEIDALPVDPAATGAIESRFYEERPNMRMYVWALDTSGGFLFGVPGEAFARLNELYDANREQLRAEGLFANRQEFLRDLVQSHADLSHVVARRDSDALEAEHGEWRTEERETVLSRPFRGPDDALLGELWRHYRDTDDGHTVLSMPIRGQGDEVLGNLYMKIVPADEQRPRMPSLEAVVAAGGTATTLAGFFLWFLLPTWVYVDASERGVRRAGLWSFLVLISFLLGLVVYLIARPEQPAALACPGCGREIDGGAFCPYCGRDLTTAFCATCRYPLKTDWTYCPSCRAEIAPRGEGAAPEAPVAS